MDEATAKRMLQKQRTVEENDSATETRCSGGLEPCQLGEPLVFEHEHGTTCKAVIIFLHGLGDRPTSWAHTLSPLRKNSPQSWMWQFLRAPKLEQPYNGYKMSGWGLVFSKECMHIDSVDHEDRSKQEYFQASVEAVRLVVEDLHRKYGKDVPIIIAGFSQGAATSLLAALTYPNLFKGCVSLSGWLLPRARDMLAGKSSWNTPPILLCHGTADEMIGIDCAEFAFAQLQACRLDVEYEEFEGLAHFVNGSALKRIARFIHYILTGREPAAGKELNKFAIRT